MPVKNPPFDYHRPTSLAAALALLAEHGDEAKVLAGGQSLLPVMALRLGRPAHLVDIGVLPDLDTITADAGGASIGALVRHATAERSSALAEFAPMVHQAMPHVGHRAIRTRGTVVGSIAHADPAAEMPAVCLAADAVLRAQSADGMRDIAAADFFDGYLTTTVRPDEIVTAVSFPAWAPTSGSAVVEIARRHGDYALLGLACRIDTDGPTVTAAALSFFGAGSTPVRLPESEALLVGATIGEAAIEAAAASAAAEIQPGHDVHASANYRRHIAGVLTRRGLRQAAERIGVPA